MSHPPTEAAAGPTGALVLIVGPSGAGKDTLMDAARMALRHEIAFRFVRRTVTRAATSGGEVHDSLSEDEFAQAERRGDFALSWRAHGLAYGIPATVLAEVAGGAVVIANVSRGAIPLAETLAKRVVVINITAPVDILAARLAARGRETEDIIRQRLLREAVVQTREARLVTIANDRTVADAATELVAVLRSLRGAGGPAAVHGGPAGYRQPDHAQD